ncbi:ATP-binding protein [Streptomyces sp. NPDC014861]|uniref:ATP-binding protein n=1 Tax=Streptomyces sp. NPDC014861 TaxID=3364923 RepID=UPI0036F81CEA
MGRAQQRPRPPRHGRPRPPPAHSLNGRRSGPNAPPEVVADLKSPTWVREGRPLVLIGDSGTAKSHLLIGIGTAIAETGLPVRYTTTSALVNELAEADANRRRSSVTARCSKIDLLCLDEFGYLNLDRKGAKLLFQIHRYGSSSRPRLPGSGARLRSRLSAQATPVQAESLLTRPS